MRQKEDLEQEGIMWIVLEGPMFLLSSFEEPFLGTGSH